jgi:hypothetical protein
LKAGAQHFRRWRQRHIAADTMELLPTVLVRLSAARAFL